MTITPEMILWIASIATLQFVLLVMVIIVTVRMTLRRRIRVAWEHCPPEDISTFEERLRRVEVDVARLQMIKRMRRDGHIEPAPLELGHGD